MHFSPTIRYFDKNNARNITYMTVLIFLENLDLRINAYSRTVSWDKSATKLFPHFGEIVKSNLLSPFF